GELVFGRDETGTPAFCISIPCHKAKTILIIDDDADTVDLYRRYLQAEAYVVCSADSGANTWALLDEMTPDLVLLDVLMPREDGWNILRGLRGRHGRRMCPWRSARFWIRPTWRWPWGRRRSCKSRSAKANCCAPWRVCSRRHSAVARQRRIAAGGRLGRRNAADQGLALAPPSPPSRAAGARRDAPPAKRSSARRELKLGAGAVKPAFAGCRGSA
ncbi:MAG TPA: response regulator, partial [Thioalkalivibrio sp.]|nr:response regulator [Thioalkalivibrio sp.]